MRKLTLLATFLLVLGMGAGCSSQTKTVTTETRENQTGGVVENKTETTTTESRDDSGGVLSSTVDVIGDVLAFPFRAVGGLFKGIF